MTTLTLYGHPGYCSLAPHAALIKEGLPFKFVKTDVDKGTTEAGQDYKQINPIGAVPAMKLEDGRILTQVAGVCWYIANTAGSMPADMLEQARFIEKLNQISDMHKGVVAHLFNGDKLLIWERRMSELESRLPNDGFLGGKEPSYADYYAATVLNWNNFAKKSFDEYPKCKMLWERVWALPEMKKALQEEGL